MKKANLLNVTIILIGLFGIMYTTYDYLTDPCISYKPNKNETCIYVGRTVFVLNDVDKYYLIKK